MDYEIYPLAYTQVDWQTLISVCQSILGISPTRGVDASYLDLKDPASYLGSLTLDNDPIKSLRENKCLAHFSMSFMVKTDISCLQAIQNNTKLSVYSKEIDRFYQLAILTGDMEIWRLAILDACKNKSTEYSYRWVMSRVYAYLQQSGLRELFYKCKKQDAGDGTILL